VAELAFLVTSGTSGGGRVALISSPYSTRAVGGESFVVLISPVKADHRRRLFFFKVVDYHYLCVFCSCHWLAWLVTTVTTQKRENEYGYSPVLFFPMMRISR
jgi:hypothetical protein